MYAVGIQRPVSDGGGDGIEAGVDIDPANYSNVFSDIGLGGTTFGQIESRDGLTVTITDEPNPAGVHVTATGIGGEAHVTVCDNPQADIYLSPGDETVLTCGSAIARVISGPIAVKFGGILAELPSGTKATAIQISPGSVSVTNAASSTADIVVGGLSVASGATTPPLVDSDHDGLVDSVETNSGVFTGSSDTGTNPNVADSDGDGLPDGLEVLATHTNPLVADTDSDGCRDGKEYVVTNADHRHGGDRDPSSPWDFTDVPVPPLLPGNSSGVRNHIISLGDVLADLQYVGTAAVNPNTPNVNGARYGSDLNTNGIPDGQEYDRAPSNVPGKVWRAGAPNGVVTLSDVLVVLASVGDQC